MEILKEEKIIEQLVKNAIFTVLKNNINVRINSTSIYYNDNGTINEEHTFFFSRPR